MTASKVRLGQLDAYLALLRKSKEVGFGDIDYDYHYSHVHGQMGAIKSYMKWREETDHMQRTFVIELRCEYVDESRYKYVEEAMRSAAQDILAVAKVLTDRKDPVIAFRSEDRFEGTSDLELQSSA